MSSPFRSEDMMLCQLYLQAESGYACVAELGELGVVEFRDLNPEENLFSREYVSEVRRAEEMLRRLRYLEKEIEAADVAIPNRNLDYDAPMPGEIGDLESTFEKLEDEIAEVNTNAKALRKNFFELNEFRTLLKYSGELFDEPALVQHRSQMARGSLMDGNMERMGAHVGFVAGTLPRHKLATFELLMWRACRGNVVTKFIEVPGEVLDPKTGEKMSKVIFAVFFQGDALRIRVNKICEGFDAAVYPVPETQAERQEVMEGLVARLEDLTAVLSQTEHYRYRVLNAAAKNLDSWFIRVQKMKAIYHTLNKFMYDFAPDCIVAECWIPTSSLDVVQKALTAGMERSGGTIAPIINRMETDEIHPTYNKTNRFTKGFQNLVDAYGIAEYKEMNPAIYAVITFPFLFGVMFGDVGHGLIMALFGAYLVWKENTLLPVIRNNEIAMMFFGGRYIIMLMGIFAVYCGLIYTDLFGKPFRIFNSGWSLQRFEASDTRGQEMINLNPATTYRGYPYPFGIDPMWIMSHNKITYMNSFKMKSSIVLGVFQMLFGLILSLTNHTYFKKPLNIWCEFVPQLLFMLCMFGYLVVLIFVKWFRYDASQSSCAPSILITFINMVMFRSPPEIEGCKAYENNLFPGQPQLQFFLMIVAIVCVPWMLLLKPIVLKRRHDKNVNSNRRGELEERRPVGGPGDIYQMSPSFEAVAQQQHPGSLLDQDSYTDAGQLIEVDSEHDDGSFDFGEVMINQAIHSIEFVLGTVSHTASYLRLWALSLAHAQLSEVLWSMILRRAFTMSIGPNQSLNFIILYPIFAAWAVLTLGVLVLMEGLSAFLHTLRLHWVEFQSKFYHGTGKEFTPFSLRLIAASPRDPAL
jgi:V-type H+-transporting ATPase subunit a